MQASLTRTSQRGGLIEFTKTLSSIGEAIVVPELIGKSGVAMLSMENKDANTVVCFVYINASRKSGVKKGGTALRDPQFDPETGTLDLGGTLDGTYLIQAW